MDGVIEIIQIAATGGEPVTAVPMANLLAQRGIEGDRYAEGTGVFSEKDYEGKQLTFVEAEVAERVGLTPAATRRNVVTRGIVLEELIGKTFKIGEATIQGIRPCDPCSYLEGLTRPGLVKDMAGKGGLRAEIIEGGVIKIGDRIVVSD